MKIGGIVLLCLAALAHASSSVLRVPLNKRTLTIEQVRASNEALKQQKLNTWSNMLRGEAEEADIPLLDFLDAQCVYPPAFACYRQPHICFPSFTLPSGTQRGWYA